jgi:hypothetical protein
VADDHVLSIRVTPRELTTLDAAASYEGGLSRSAMLRLLIDEYTFIEGGLSLGHPRPITRREARRETRQQAAQAYLDRLNAIARG